MGSQKEQVLSLARRLGVIRPRDLDELHIDHQVLRRLYDRGEIIRIGRGLYRLADAPVTEHHTLVEVGKRVPQGVVCLMSALWYHGITSQAPYEIWMAIDRKAWRVKTDNLSIRFVTFSGEAMTEGIETHTMEGVQIRVFNPAKTVADCFKSGIRSVSMSRLKP